MKLLVIGQNAWGEGKEVDEAFKNAFKNIPYNMRERSNKGKYKGKKVFSLHIASDEDYVNSMGGINYTLANGAPKLVCYLDIDCKPIIDLTEHESKPSPMVTDENIASC